MQQSIDRPLSIEAIARRLGASRRQLERHFHHSVGMAPMPSRNEAERFVVADRAIARLDTLIARWRTEGDGAPEDIRRARLDRILAYHADRKSTRLNSSH